jgi:hypothetical protein
MSTAAVMTVLAAQTALWLVLGLSSLLFVIALALSFVVYLAAFDGGEDDVADVQRFIELREEARRLVPPGLPLFDAERAAATADALVLFQAKKAEARRALWPSRHERRAVGIEETARARFEGVLPADSRPFIRGSRLGGVP